MKNYERITDDPMFDGTVRESHELRYKIAAMLLSDGDVVIDAGCGTGYGRPILEKAASISYAGLDKNPPLDDKLRVKKGFTKHDFEAPYEVYDIPIFLSYDVFVGLEIIEHLETVDHFAKMAMQARKWIVISTPIVPNSNPFHKKQYSREFFETGKTFNTGDWRHHLTLVQDKKYGIFIFKKS